MAINFPLNTSLTASHKFWCVVSSFISRYFPISLVVSFLSYWLFRIAFFFPQVFMNFSNSVMLLISFQCGWRTYLFDFDHTMFLS